MNIVITEELRINPFFIRTGSCCFALLGTSFVYCTMLEMWMDNSTLRNISIEDVLNESPVNVQEYIIFNVDLFRPIK